MPLTEDEMAALRLLLREELQAELNPFRAEIARRLNEIASQVDGLYQRDEAPWARNVYRIAAVTHRGAPLGAQYAAAHYAPKGAC